MPVFGDKHPKIKRTMTWKSQGRSTTPLYIFHQMASNKKGDYMNYSTFKNISDLTMGEPLHYKKLTLFALKGSDFSSIRYITLQQATKERLYKISEISEEGSVPELKFTNNGSLPILIVEGSGLIGAKQNRVLNTSVLAPGNQTIIIPVSCCERSRWAFHSSRDFSFQDRSMYSSSRFHKVASVNESWTNSGYAESDQQKVWAQVSGKNQRFRVDSDTESMGDFYDTYKSHMDEYVKVYKAEANDLGICAAIGSQIALIELFDCNKTFAENLQMIIRSLAADAIEISQHQSVPAKADAEAFLQKLLKSNFTVMGQIGMAQQVKIANIEQEGQGLIYDSSFIHCFQFNRAFFRNF